MGLYRFFAILASLEGKMKNRLKKKLLYVRAPKGKVLVF